jgi:hypothetical protein
VKMILQNTLYSEQGNDFFVLKIPKGHPDENKLVPIDWSLKCLVEYFWKKGFITVASDQGDTWNSAFITFQTSTVDRKNTFDVLHKFATDNFGSNVIIIDNTNQIFHSEMDAYDAINKRKNDDIFLRNHPDLVILEKQSQYILFKFNFDAIPWLHKKIGIKMPTYSQALPGMLQINGNENIIDYDLPPST